MRWETLPNGKTAYYFRQSWLGTYLTCPDRARMLRDGVVEDVTSEAAAIGTGMHSGIEVVVRDGVNMAAGLEAVREAYEAEHERGLNYVSIKKKETALAVSERCFVAWYEKAWPECPPFDLVEHKFRQRVAVRDTYELWLEGMVDAANSDPDHPYAWDWKTAGRAYEGWEKQRWAIQPTVYTMALASEFGWEQDILDWTYCIVIKGGNPTIQFLPVTRCEADHYWLVHLLDQIVSLSESTATSWPLNDQHALCSAKWCPAWDVCKGKYTF